MCSVELYSLCIYEALEEIVMSYNESIKKLTIFSFFLFIREKISSCPCTLDPEFFKTLFEDVIIVSIISSWLLMNIYHSYFANPLG